MKRVGGNVSIEKVAQPKPNAVTITRASSSSSHDDNNEDDDYYDEDEEEEFEPSPPVVRTPNLSQVQITPRNVSRPALNITPVVSRSLPQVSSNIEPNTQKIPDRPFKIFSKENKGLHSTDDDIIIESTSVKSSPLPNFVKPNPHVRNLAPPIRAPRMTRPGMGGPHIPRARAPSLSPLRPVSPRQPQPIRNPSPQVRGRLPSLPVSRPMTSTRGRPRVPFSPYQRGQTPPAARMQFNPRVSQSPQRLPRTPGGFNSAARGPVPRAPMTRQGRLRLSTPAPNTPPARITRNLSSQIQITPRNAVPKPSQNLQVLSQPMVNIKPEPQDYEEDYESDSYEDEFPANMPPPKTIPPQKFSQVNITPTGNQTARSAPPTVPRISSSVQITPKVSSQVQITPRSVPHVTQAKAPVIMNRQDEEEHVNIKEEPLEAEPTEETYDEYGEDQEEEYYNEEEADREEEDYDEYDAQQKGFSSGSRSQVTPALTSVSTGRQSSAAPNKEVLPATPVSLANIKQGPIIKEEPKDEDRDAEMSDDYYDEENYEEESYDTTKSSQPLEATLAVQPSNTTSRVSSSVHIIPKVGSQVQLTPQKKIVQPNTLPAVSSSLQITPAKQSPMSESEEQFDDSFEEETEGEEYYDEEMEDDQMSDYAPFTQASTAGPQPLSVPQAQLTPNKFQNVSITPNQATPVLPKKMSGVSITPNKPQLGSFPLPVKSQGVSFTPNVPKGVTIAPNKFQNISISPSKIQTGPVPPNLPKGISITPKNQQYVPISSSSVALTSNKPQGISITPRENPQVSKTRSNVSQQESEAYYEEEEEEELGEEEEEESFEDYDEDDLHENHPRLDTSQQLRSNTNPAPTNVSSSVQLSQKPPQLKGDPRVQHMAKPSPALGSTNAPAPQETRAQFSSTKSTPTKSNSSEVKKQATPSKSPVTNSYQSPISQDPAPHGRPRSLIEAISMISSGKMCVSNLSAPSTSKKTPKKEENTEKNIDTKPKSPEQVFDKLKVQDSNDAANTVKIDDTKPTGGAVENNLTTPVKEEHVSSIVNVQETLKTNESGISSTEVSKVEDNKTDDFPKSPRAKMRPKSKLLQFRKQMKNPIVPEDKPQTEEAKTNTNNSQEMHSTPVISDVNINEDRAFNTSNETSSVNEKHQQNDNTKIRTVEKTDVSEEKLSKQEQSTCQNKVVENSKQDNDKTNLNQFSITQTQNPNSETLNDEMVEQVRTEHEDNKNDIDKYNDNNTSLEQESNLDSEINDTKEGKDNTDNEQTVIEQKEASEMVNQSIENISEGIPPPETNETVESGAEEKMDTGEDMEVKEELDEDMAEQIMREQEDEYQAGDFNNAEEEQEQAEKELQQEEKLQDEENEEDDEEEEDEECDDEQSEEDETVDKDEEDASAEETDGMDKEAEEKKKPKKKGKKRKKPKKRTAKRKSTDNKSDETPAAKKSKTDDDETKESAGDKDDGADKSGSNKAINLRKNIRDVIDENQLDPATLAAQREEAERLKRVQEQQQRLKEVQRQIAQNNKAAKMMNLLEGENSGSSKPSPVVFNLSSGSLNKQMLELLKSQKKEEEGEAGEGASGEAAGPKLPNLEASSLAHPLNITSSVSLVPVKKTAEPAQKAKDASTGGTEVTLSDSDEDCILISEPSDEEGSGEEDRDDPSNSGMHTNDEFNVPDDQGRVLVNLAHEPSEPDIFLAPQIARIIKPHQVGGIRFLFDNIIETTERYKTSPGFGCILAHSMGLGKTLQIVSFSDIFLRHTDGRTVVCIMPINTLQNWVSEFNMWLPLAADLEKSPLLSSGEVRPREFPIFILNDFQKNLPARAKVIKDWYTQGGVLMIGYELYRQLSLKKPKKTRRGRGKETAPPEEEPDDRKQQLLEEIYEALVSPGPDLVICDEGHRIKNSHASTSHALKQIKTRRRVVLTGYPLQNNLLEYWCMVDFVRPNYLGTKTEFSNMFERPIQNGQCVDSTPQDVRLMRHRAHVLHSLLQGFVQRRSHMVLQKTLPVKEEYVLLIRMTPLQRQLYETFMNEVVRTKAVPNPLKAFAVCCKIWNHPDVLYNFLKKRQGGSEDVVADLDIEENAAIVAGCEPGTPSKRGSRSKAGGGRNAASKNAKKGSSSKGPDAAKSPAVATVMPNINSSPAPIPTSTPGSYNYNNYSGNTGDGYASNNFNPSPAYYNNAPDSGGNYWSQTPPYSNTSGYHTDTSSNFTDITETSLGSMGSMNPPSAFGQNMNNYNSNYGGNNEFNMQPGNSGMYSGYMGGTSSGNAFGTPDATAAYSNTPGFNSSSTNNDSFGVNNSMYSSPSPFETNPSNPNAHSFNTNQFGGSFNEGSSMYSSANANASSFNSNQTPASSANNNFTSNQMPLSSDNNFNSGNANSSAFNANQMPSTANDLDSAGGLVDMMLSEFPTPNPFDETRPSGGVGEAQSGEAATGEGVTSTGGEGEKVEVMEEEKGENGGEGEKSNGATESTTPVKTSGREEPGIPYDWAEKLMKDYVPGRVEEGNKMVVFMCILEQSLAAGDRILVFSQSLTTLTLIEQFLMKRFVPGRQERWARNKNYFRLDGSTISTDREKLINEFNSNDQVAMFLVSTRAGSLGINLVGANRVIVFDASWNPCHDTQAVCRVYRYGQQKPCFVYRLVMDSCLEKKIYDRQINKQGMADRVVDECNPDAHLSIKEVTNLCWDNEPVPEEKDFSSIKDKYRDSIIQLILDLHSFKLSKEPFQHESLLVDRKDKKLSSAEKRLAKRSYEMEKQAQTKPVYGGFKNNLGKPMASVRPMQSLGGLNMLREGIGAPRNRQWIPAEVWQKQGMSAQEMKLPLDVIIPTNSNERSIVLKKDQKVMVLKSPKGIYMQLENGKIIAIRTANNKGGLSGKDMLGGLGGLATPPRPRMNTTTRVIDSRFARDVSVTSTMRMHHGPRGPRHMTSRGHRATPLPQPPRFKNVSITPSRPNLVKRNAPTHSVSCGTTTSPPSSPMNSPLDQGKSFASAPSSDQTKSLPSPSSENSKDKIENSPATDPSSMNLSQPSPVSMSSDAPDVVEAAAQDLSFSQPGSSTSGSLRGENQITSLRDTQIGSSLRTDGLMSSSSIESQMSSSLRGESQITCTVRGGNQMSSSLQDQSMGSSRRGESEITSSLRGENQITSSSLEEVQITGSLREDSHLLGSSSILGDSTSLMGSSSMLVKSQSLSSSLLGDSTAEPYSRSMTSLAKNDPLRPSDDLSLMNFDPAQNPSLEYGYEYPAYGTTGGTSDFYSAPSYQHTPLSAPVYTNTAAESGSSYPYEMYSPFPSAAGGNSSFTPVSYGSQSSAFHRPDSYQQPPPPYPPQYPSEFYPPPP